MARTRLPVKKIDHSSASATSYSDVVDCFANLNLKKKKMKKKKNNGRIPLSPVFEIQRNAELAAKRMADELAKKVADYSKGFRPAIPLMLYRWVKDAIDVMSHPDYLEDGLEMKLAEASIALGCTIFSSLLPVGWKYQRENASSLIAGYETVFRMDVDGQAFIM